MYVHIFTNELFSIVLLCNRKNVAVKRYGAVEVAIVRL
jgi:hypothetical protein